MNREQIIKLLCQFGDYEPDDFQHPRRAAAFTAFCLVMTQHRARWEETMTGPRLLDAWVWFADGWHHCRRVEQGRT